MTLANIIDSVYFNMRQSGTNNNRLTKAMVTSIINQVYVDVAMATGCFLSDGTLSTVDGKSSYAFPTGVFAIKYMEVVKDGDVFPMYRTSQPVLSGLFVDWKSEPEGLPEYYFCDDAREFALFPCPDAIYTVNYRGYQLPLATPPAGGVPFLNLDSDKPQLPEGTHEVLVFGSCIKLLKGMFATAEGSADKAKSFADDYNGLLVKVQGNKVV